MEKLRADFHLHSFFSDGELLPSEIVRRMTVLGHQAIALTDHADSSNMEMILNQLKKFQDEQGPFLDLDFFIGVELTHVAPKQIKSLAEKAKKLGAQIVVIHGETIAEPVAPGTNREAATAKGLVDILAHPGFITGEDAARAKENGVFLEITSRSLHNATNGHVAAAARRAGALLLVNTDGHSPRDFIDFDRALAIAEGAGLTREEAVKAVVENSRDMISRIKGK